MKLTIAQRLGILLNDTNKTNREKYMILPEKVMETESDSRAIFYWSTGEILEEF